MSRSPVPSRYLWIVILVGLVIVASLVVMRPKPLPTLKAKQIPGVETVAVARMDIEPVIHISGQLKPVSQVRVSAEISGRIVSRSVVMGQVVEKGQVLLKIDDEDLLTALDKAKALKGEEGLVFDRDRQLLDLAKEEMVLLKREEERLNELESKSLSSMTRKEASRLAVLRKQVEITKLEFLVANARNRIDLAGAGVHVAQSNLKRSEVRAPWKGRVNQVAVDVGDLAVVGQPLFEMVATDVLELDLAVTGQVAASMSFGQVIVVAVGEISTQGTVSAIAQVPDAKTLTYDIRIRLEHPGAGVLPGLIATATIPLDVVKNAMVVPVTAILRDEGRDYVFVVDGDRLRKTPVRSGARKDNLQAIIGELSAPSEVVANHVFSLTDGQQVHIMTGQ